MYIYLSVCVCTYTYAFGSAIINNHFSINSILFMPMRLTNFQKFTGGKLVLYALACLSCCYFFSPRFFTNPKGVHCSNNLVLS